MYKQRMTQSSSSSAPAANDMHLDRGSDHTWTCVISSQSNRPLSGEDALRTTEAPWELLLKEYTLKNKQNS